MELVYFLIAIIEVILTIFLTKSLCRLKNTVDALIPCSDKIIPMFNITKKTFKLTANIFKYAKHTSKINKILGYIKAGVSIVSAAHLLIKKLGFIKVLKLIEKKFFKIIPKKSTQKKIKETLALWFN